jgi:hypothetical protein
MFNTNAAILYWLSQQRQWPPKFPRTETLLAPHDDPKTPRDEWGAAEWQAYALFLEESGKTIIRDLNRSDADLQNARRNKSRSNLNSRRKQRAMKVSLLGNRDQKTYGRKPNGRMEVIAAEVIAIRKELEARGQQMTDLSATQEWRTRNGMPPSRPRELRSIRNAISKYRRSHNISMR